MLNNAQLAELLIIESANHAENKLRAYSRAARKAFLWGEEAADIVAAGRPLTELEGIGPYLAVVVKDWIETPPPVSEPPPLRADFLTMAEAKRLLDRSPAWRGIRGDLQMHSTWSDGYGSIGELAEAAHKHHQEYIAITDHSKGLAIAGGIDEQQFAAQAEEIRELNDQFSSEGRKLRILRSIELNLSTDGSGDMDPGFLTTLDIVLGSFHSKLRLKEDQTERYLAALRNPDLHVLGHPRGRMYNFRLGLNADWINVFEEAAQLGKAVEIDAFPDRQDLNVELLRLAAKCETMISIGTDAHHPSQLHFIDLGLATALRAGVRLENILNFKPVKELIGWVEHLRGG